MYEHPTTACAIVRGSPMRLLLDLVGGSAH
jgi:hypothetical protein